MRYLYLHLIGRRDEYSHLLFQSNFSRRRLCIENELLTRKFIPSIPITLSIFPLTTKYSLTHLLSPCEMLACNFYECIEAFDEEDALESHLCDHVDLFRFECGTCGVRTATENGAQAHCHQQHSSATSSYVSAIFYSTPPKKISD